MNIVGRQKDTMDWHWMFQRREPKEMQKNYQLKAVIFDITAECLELKKELSEAGILIVVPFFGLQAEHTMEEMLSGTEIAPKDCLMITNNEQHAELAKEQGMIVVGCIEGSQRAPREVTLLESPEEVSAGYLNQEFCHKRGLPAFIAETKRCIVREMTSEDADALYEILTEKEVRKYLSGTVGSRQEEREKLESYVDLVYSFFGYGYWGVYNKQSGELIGRAGFKEGSFPLEAGYVMKRSEWGKGLATEVLTALFDYAKQELAATELVLKIDSENKASQRVAEKCGFSVLEKGMYVKKL